MVCRKRLKPSIVLSSGSEEPTAAAQLETGAMMQTGAAVAPERLMAATRMPRMTRKTRMLTLLPTLSDMTVNIVRMDSRMLPPVNSRAPEKMPMIRDM